MEVTNIEVLDQVNREVWHYYRGSIALLDFILLDALIKPRCRAPGKLGF